MSMKAFSKMFGVVVKTINTKRDLLMNPYLPGIPNVIINAIPTSTINSISSNVSSALSNTVTISTNVNTAVTNIGTAITNIATLSTDVSGVNTNILARPTWDTIQTGMLNNFTTWVSNINTEMPFVTKSLEAVIGSMFLDMNDVYQQAENPFPNKILVDINNIITIQDREDYLKLDINYCLYQAQKTIIDFLYDATVSLISEFNTLLPEDVEFILPLPSGAGFKIAEKINDVWTVIDFRLGAYNDNSVPIWVKMWNFVIKLPDFKIPHITLPEIIWPKLFMKFKNSQISAKDLYWKEEGTWVLGSTIGRYYMLSDLIVDSTVTILVVGISAALIHFGLSKLNEYFKRAMVNGKANSFTSWSTVQQIISTASTATGIASKLSNIDENTIPNVKTSIDNITDDLNAATSNLNPLLTGFPGLFADLGKIYGDIDTIKNNIIYDPVQQSDLEAAVTQLQAKLNEIKTVIGLKLAF